MKLTNSLIIILVTMGATVMIVYGALALRIVSNDPARWLLAGGLMFGSVCGMLLERLK